MRRQIQRISSKYTDFVSMKRQINQNDEHRLSICNDITSLAWLIIDQFLIRADKQIYSQQMSHHFFDFDTLEKGTNQMVSLIEECYSKTDCLVLPAVKPGSLRHALPDSPPEEGESLEFLIQRTKNAIFPCVMNWQSPKYFGYYPSSVNVTSVLAQMFAVSFHSPGFSYAVAPAYTELENIVVDWSAKVLGLPSKFLLKNQGGGIINNSTTQSIFVSVHAAKLRKMKELNIAGNNPDILKLVGYYGQGSHISSERGLTIKDIYYRRAAPYVYNAQKLNYEIDIAKFKAIIEEDIKNGLIPFWFGGSYGTTFSAAIDMNDAIANLCKKHGMWINVDAAFLGSTWISQKYRPGQWLQQIDSIAINFSKLLLNGTGGSLFYVGDKKQLNQAFGANSLKFSFYKNEFSDNYDIVDYKDWIVGLGRRNNALKIYYTFVHYGADRIRKSVEQLEQKAKFLINKIRDRKDLFEIFSLQYTVIAFQMKDLQGKISDKLTREVANHIKNANEGFSSPSEFQGNFVIRIVIGNFHTSQEHIDRYYNFIVATAEKLQKQQSA